MSHETLRVLVVEDSRDQAELVEDILASIAHYHATVTHAERLASALRLLDTESFDLILLDLNLPDSRGLAVVRETRAIDYAK